MTEPESVARVYGHVKQVVEALQIGGEPPPLPDDFTDEEVRLVRVGLWAYAKKSGQPIPEVPPEIAALITAAKEGEEWKSS